MKKSIVIISKNTTLYDSSSYFMPLHNHKHMFIFNYSQNLHHIQADINFEFFLELYNDKLDLNSNYRTNV